MGQLKPWSRSPDLIFFCCSFRLSLYFFLFGLFMAVWKVLSFTLFLPYINALTIQFSGVYMLSKSTVFSIRAILTKSLQSIQHYLRILIDESFISNEFKKLKNYHITKRPQYILLRLTSRQYTILINRRTVL